MGLPQNVYTLGPIHTGHWSIGEYCNISDVPVLQKYVIFTFFTEC